MKFEFQFTLTPELNSLAIDTRKIKNSIFIMILSTFNIDDFSHKCLRIFNSYNNNNKIKIYLEIVCKLFIQFYL